MTKYYSPSLSIYNTNYLDLDDPSVLISYVSNIPLNQIPRRRLQYHFSPFIFICSYGNRRLLIISITFLLSFLSGYLGFYQPGVFTTNFLDTSIGWVLVIIFSRRRKPQRIYLFLPRRSSLPSVYLHKYYPQALLNGVTVYLHSPRPQFLLLEKAKIQNIL